MASKKTPLSKPTFVFPMICAGVLAIAFLIYYFPVTERQEAALNNRAFRSLGLLGDSFQNRALNYATVFKQAMKSKNPRDLLKEQAPDLLLSGPPADCGADEIKLNPKWTSDGYVLEFSCAGSSKTSATVTMDDAFVPFLSGAPDSIFDEILLADEHGTVLYQTLKTGNRFSNLASVALAGANTRTLSEQENDTAVKKETAKPPERFPVLSLSSALVPVVVGGTNYKLYLTPVRLKHAETRNGDSSGGDHLVAAGLIRQQRFRAETLAVPGDALLSFVLIVLAIIIAAWPPLKFTFMKPTERIPRRTAVYFFVSTLGTIILLCILAIHLRYMFDMTQTDDNLKNLATAIQGNLVDELEHALQVMDSMNHSPQLDEDMKNYSSKKQCKDVILATDTSLAKDARTRILKEKGLQLSDYPYFDRIFFLDSKGNQTFKWEVANQATSPTNVSDRVYFRETIDGNLWHIPGSPGGMRFRLDPIFSKNTGEYRAVISTKLFNRALCTNEELSVLSMVTPLLSLTDPVLPPDYGFALVDRDGSVLFHSTSTKNGRENFFDELDDARDLRVAILAAREKDLSARYGGFDTRMRVTPLSRIEQNPWSLIVFRDLSQGAAQNLERIILFTVLSLAYFVIIAIPLLLTPSKHLVPDWIWPKQESAAAYIQLTLTLALLAPAFYQLIFLIERPRELLVIACAIPLLVLALTVFKLKSSNSWSGRPVLGFASRIGTLFSCRYGFAALCALLLLFTGVLPCVAFFRVAYDYHADLSTRQQQLQTIAMLTAREERVKARYRNLDLKPETGQSDNVEKWLFMRRRLEETADRYDTVFLNLQGQELTAMSNPDPHTLPCMVYPTGSVEDRLPQEIVTIATAIPYRRGTLTKNLSESSPADPSWRWCREGSNRVRLMPRKKPNFDEASYSLAPSRALIKSVTDDPVFLFPSIVSELPVLRPWSWLAATLIFISGWVIAYFWVKQTLGKMFLEDMQSIEVFPSFHLDEPVIRGNMILLAADTSPASAILSRRGDVRVLDFVDLLRGGSVHYETIRLFIVAIDHFDYKLGDPDADSKRLEILEQLVLKTAGNPIVLLTSVDPIFYFRAGSGSGSSDQRKHSERWTRVLHGFERRLLSVSAPPAEGDYALIWAACTTAERVALSQLQHERWVNPRNDAALVHLQRRGLIAGIPFDFVDPGFEKFVERSVSKDDRRAWQKEDTVAAWDGIRLTFVVLLLGILAAAMFFNQETSLSYIFTGLGVLTPVTKLLSETRSLRGLLGWGENAE
jgi:hypothetical protein